MADGSTESAPIDFDVLDDVRAHLERSDRFEAVELRPPYAPDSLVCHYDGGWYPSTVDEAFLEMKWYVNDDFKLHYQEQWSTGEERRCRWDRHPNEHNTRDHYHPLPNAETPGRNEDYPDLWKDVLSQVLRSVDERLESFWE
jgi:hypothetical protein